MDNIAEARKKARKRRKTKKYPYSSISYTTGDIGLNINRFNQAMGSLSNLGLDFNDEDNNDSVDNTANIDTGDSDAGGDGCCESLKLAEAKRYVRRYYIRPMNIFCSNKAEILKALIDNNHANCTVYTLNNLGDEKDVSRLMNSDIIYYYDEGILYDKNHVRVMDYDLGVKREENRKKLTKVDDNSKEFKSVYSDRLTAATELEEAFNLDFDSYNVFGEKLTENTNQTCCICGEPLDGYGNNPEPFMSSTEGSCCDACNTHFVLPMRLSQLNKKEN